MERLINEVKISEETVFSFKANPKHVNSKAWARYEEYSKATNYEEYIQISIDGEFKKYANADLRYDQSKGFLIIDGEEPTIEEPTIEEPTEEELDQIEEEL